MFGRKKKRQPALTVYGEGRAVLYEGPLAQLALPEDVVLRLSVEFFGDPEPCHIHRSAVQSRACLELCDACAGRVRLDALPERMRAYFGAHPGAVEAEVTE